MRTLMGVAAAVALAAGCRSPFETPRGPSADEWRVGRGFHAWPVFEYAPEDEGSRTDVLWPGLSVWKGKEGVEDVEFLFPLGEWSRKDGHARTAFRPLFDLETEEPTEKAPEGVWDLDLVWPIAKWRESGRRDERRVFPVYWYERTASRRMFHVWPVYGESDEGTRDDHWIAAPLVHWATDTATNLSEWDAPWPLVHHGESDEETTWRALPLLWHDASRKSEDHHTVVFPFWWDFREGDVRFRMLFPVYGERWEGDESSLVIVGGPLYVGRRDGDETSTGVLWPIFDVTTSPDAWSWRAAPLLWFGARGEERGHSVVWPLFAAWHEPSGEGLSVVPPLVWHERDGDETDLWAPFPLARFVRAPDHGQTMVFPLFSSSHRGDESTLWMAIPLFGTSRAPDHGWTWALPVYHEWGPHGSEGSFLGVLSTWESDTKEGTSDFRVLWRLVESTSAPHKSTFVVNPFWREESNDRGDSYWSVLFGLLARKQEAGEVDWRVLWVF